MNLYEQLKTHAFSLLQGFLHGMEIPSEMTKKDMEAHDAEINGYVIAAWEIAGKFLGAGENRYRPRFKPESGGTGGIAPDMKGNKAPQKPKDPEPAQHPRLQDPVDHEQEEEEDDGALGAEVESLVNAPVDVPEVNLDQVKPTGPAQNNQENFTKTRTAPPPKPKGKGAVKVSLSSLLNKK